MTLTGDVLIRAITVTSTPISLYYNNIRVRDLSDTEVLVLLRDPRYEFVGRRSRVRYVRQLDPSAVIETPWSPSFSFCWRTVDAAVLWPYADREVRA